VSTAKNEQSDGRFISLYIGPPADDFMPAMTDINLATWGMIVVPIGVAVCFGPALLVWLREEIRPESAEKDKPQNKR
jgi:hypothetical protein